MIELPHDHNFIFNDIQLGLLIVQEVTFNDFYRVLLVSFKALSKIDFGSSTFSELSKKLEVSIQNWIALVLRLLTIIGGSVSTSAVVNRLYRTILRTLTIFLVHFTEVLKHFFGVLFGHVLESRLVDKL